MIRAGLLAILAAAVFAAAYLPTPAHAQGAGAAKAQLTRTKSPAASASSNSAVTTSREAKEKTCIQ